MPLQEDSIRHPPLAEGRLERAPPQGVIQPPDLRVPREAPAGRAAERPGIYIPVRAKFMLALAGALAWAALSAWLSLPWHDDLSGLVGPLPATLLIGGIAIIPGFMNAFMVVALVFDRRPRRRPLAWYPPISILIAAYNEADSIRDTLRSIDAQDYPGILEVVVVDDGSLDATAAIVRESTVLYPWLQLMVMPRNGGKAAALNAGLAACRHDLVVTIDADSFIYRDGLQHIVERYLQDPPGTRAVAGCVLVRNSRASWIARAQEWDYFLGIAVIKRVQSLFQGTLVAQGAFSIYDRATLIEIGGWPESVGEDIVLSWSLLRAGYRIGYSEDACLFTNAPTTLGQFVGQRQRWARGMLEAFKQNGGILLKPRMSTLFVYWNLLFPYLDAVYTFGFLPGLILACLGHYWIAGPMTLALLPLAFLVNAAMFQVGKRMFDESGLQVRRNLQGLFIYTLGYSMVLQPASVIGYVKEFINTRKGWVTK